MLRPLSPSQRETLERATAEYQKHLDRALAYLEARGISPAIAETFRLGVVVDPLPGHEGMRGRLAIPSLGRGDTVYALRFRALGNVDKFKYLGLPGVDLRLFNVRALHDAGDTIHITEGELDAISLGACGFSSVGVPGTPAGWKPHHPRLLAGFRRVYVWGDGDSAGREFAQRIAREVDTAIVVHLQDGDDVNQILVRDGVQAIRAMIGEP